MIRLLRNIWNTPDLRSKILFTLFIIGVYRILTFVPMAGVNVSQLRSLISGNQLLDLINLFSGGGLANFSIVGLGLNPYINASIIIQLLTMVFPKLEELSKEGEQGQQKINRYTRYLTVPLAIVQGIGAYALLRSQGIIQNMDLVHVSLLILTMTAGALLLVWLGELVTEKGIGNGVSILIFAGILAQLPVQLQQALATQTSQGGTVWFVLAIVAIIIVMGIVFITEGQRRIPVQYAKRLSGNKLVGGQSTYIPLRVNQAGVIPIIFAVSLVLFPGTVASYLVNNQIDWIAKSAQAVQAFFNDTFYFALIYFVLVVAFSFFYSTVTFNPTRIAEDLQKYGGFVPGIRPGKSTSDYLQQILVKVTLIGGLFLGIIAVLPYIMRAMFPDIGSLALGGTSLLIVIAVILETAKQVESMLVMRNYEGFLRS
jgi:preprotein translocase subunit SecY